MLDRAEPFDFLLNTNDLRSLFRECASKAEHIDILAAWATLDCGIISSLREHQAKLRTLIVGLDFFITSPDFLKEFRQIVRIPKYTLGTFHPKLYLFEAAGQYSCIVGSSNLTAGGFAKNLEASLLVAGRIKDPNFAKVAYFVEEQRSNSSPIGSATLDDYRKKYKRYKASRNVLEKYKPAKAPLRKDDAETRSELRIANTPMHFNHTWKGFVKRVLAPGRRLYVLGKRGDDSYLETAEICQQLFRKKRALSAMSRDERRFVGGTLGDSGSGYFGSMFGSGYFKQRIDSEPLSLDQALDHIPFSGPITHKQYLSFVHAYKRKGATIVTGSRLLAMKRPDLFVCINSKNEAGLAAVFSVTVSSLNDYDMYWEFIQRVWSCPWWQEKRPKGPTQRRIWSSRAALLDSFFYVDLPVNKAKRRSAN